MNFLTLSGSSFILRPFREEDAPALARHANNRKVWAQVRDIFPHPYSVDDALFFIRNIANNGPHTNLAIEIEGQTAGSVGLVVQEDVYRPGLELGYWIGEAFWGRGIVSEAVGLMLHYGFQKDGVERIFAQVFDHNLGSIRVLEKNGFAREGILRRAVIKDGQVRDLHLFGLLKTEYQKTK